MAHAGELAVHGFWPSVGAWIWTHLPARVRRFLAARFGDVSRSEAWGYIVWGAMGVVVAVPEIWAAASGEGFLWPTISSTIGHLEDIVDVVAVIPVALVGAAAYSVLHYQAAEVTLQADMKALGRTPQGRLTKGDVSVADLQSGTTQVAQLDRREWPAVPYFALATLLVVAGSLAAAQANDKWILAYVLYGLIALFWIVVPNWAAYWHRTDVPFTTLFFTVRCLERRLHTVAILVAAGLAVLFVHLALFPWPDLARSSASYAGLTPAKAEKNAERKLHDVRQGKSKLVMTTKRRGIVRGRDAWLVYFAASSDAPYTGCYVTVTKKDVVASQACAQ